MMTKVDWNDLSDICASESLKELAKEKCGGQKCLFIDFNNECDNILDAAIVKLIEREYPDNIVYEELHETWGSGVNAFVFGDDLLGKDDDFDIDEVEYTLEDWVLMKNTDIINDLEYATIKRDWDKFAEYYNLDRHNYLSFQDFANYLRDNSSIGYFSAEFDWDKCYNSMTGKEGE